MSTGILKGTRIYMRIRRRHKIALHGQSCSVGDFIKTVALKVTQFNKDTLFWATAPKYGYL